MDRWWFTSSDRSVVVEDPDNCAVSVAVGPPPPIGSASWAASLTASSVIRERARAIRSMKWTGE